MTKCLPDISIDPRNRFRHWLALAGFTLAMAILAGGCDREKHYDQSTPQATVDSFVDMVRNGDVQRIPELISTSDENLTRTLYSTGVILLRMQRLGETVREEYPDDVDRLMKRIKEDATKKIEEMGRNRGREGMGDEFQAFLLDPAPWIEEQMDRVDVVYVEDELYAIQFDRKPVFGVGILLRLNTEDNKWYFVWPENIPGLSTAMPKTEAEWQILRSILKSVANGSEWTENAIAEGKADDLEEVWEQVVRNVAPNIVIGWLLYEQAIKKRPKDDG